MNDYEREILDNIDQDGFHMTAVVDPEEVGPPFVYTVGLPTSLGQPEVIMFGLDPYTAGYFLKLLFLELKRGTRLKDGLEFEVGDASVIFRKIGPKQLVKRYFNSAIWYHREHLGNKFAEAYQIVMPDPVGRFPWDPGCYDDIRAAQPALYENGTN